MQLRFKKIRTKLQFYSLLLIFLAVVIVGVFYTYIYRSNTYNQVRNEVDQLLILDQKILKSEQNFFSEDARSENFLKNGESRHLKNYKRYLRQNRDLLQKLQRNALTQKLDVRAEIQKISRNYEQHNKTLITLSNKIKQRGYKNYGLEGKMQAAIEDLNVVDSLNQISFLTLRKHEKDFFLHKEQKYADLFQAEANRLLILTKDLKPNGAAALPLLSVSETINRYARHFDRIVAIEKEIGQTEKSGLRGALAEVIQKNDRQLSRLDDLVDKKLSVFVNQSSWLITIFLIIVLVFAFILAFVFSHRFTRPIIGLDRIARSVTSGIKNQDQLLERKVFNRDDELGSLASSVKIIIQRLRNTIQLAQEKDEILDAFAEKESIRSWHSEGLVTFNEVLRDHPDNLEKLSFALVSELVKYTNSAQGGLFILNEEEEGQEPVMELKGCYAYDRKKYLNKTLKIGEGLVGTVWREDKTMKIKDIPQNYAYINTGLGKARPSCLLIVPIKSRDRIEGVIELISFKEYKDYEVNFIETLSQRIGSALTNIKASAKTKELLQVSEEIARKAKEKESALQTQLDAYKLDVADFRARLDAAFAEAQMYESILGKVYAGLIVTDDEFKITKVNKLVTSLYGYQENELIGESIDVLIETNYDNILDLPEKTFHLNYQLFNQNVRGKIVDKKGEANEVEMMCEKLEVEATTIYVFLFNELEVLPNEPRKRNLKVAS